MQAGLFSKYNLESVQERSIKQFDELPGLIR